LLVRIGELRTAWQEQKPIHVVHYGCENFYIVKDRPVGISCISFVDVGSRSDVTFSIIDRREEGEVSMLKSYFSYLGENPDARIVHWNMNQSYYGFRAIATRYTFLTEAPAPNGHPADRLYDLGGLVAARYGDEYADDPKMYNLGKLNRFATTHILNGTEEAERFDRKQHGDVRRSVVEKAQMIAFLLRRFLSGTLETKGAGPYVQFAGGSIDSVQIALALGERFRYVERQLLRRHEGRDTLKIADEYDAQDLYHALLRIFFTDVRPEEWTPSYAGSSMRIDFVLPEHGLAIELKRARKSMTKKTLGAELTVDVENYGKHPDVRHLVCLVFDHEGIIENPRGLERDLSRVHEGLAVTARIFDR
jgi:REase_DpnII-MboI